jgi:hypothetical protein
LATRRRIEMTEADEDQLARTGKRRHLPLLQTPEPETAKMLVERGHPYLASLIAAIWLLTRMVGSAGLLLSIFVVIHGSDGVWPKQDVAVVSR